MQAKTRHLLATALAAAAIGAGETARAADPMVQRVLSLAEAKSVVAAAAATAQ